MHDTDRSRANITVKTTAAPLFNGKKKKLSYLAAEPERLSCFILHIQPTLPTMQLKLATVWVRDSCAGNAADVSLSRKLRAETTSRLFSFSDSGDIT